MGGLTLAWKAGLAYAPPTQAAPPLNPSQLDSYIAQVARAWQPYTTPDGQLLDPLDAADSGDNYGVILLADVMLRLAARDGDASLAATGERIIHKATTLPIVEGPFNLLAIALLLHDGQTDRFPPGSWARLNSAVTNLAARVRPRAKPSCLTTAGCYNNWRLVWSSALAMLMASHKHGTSGPASSPTEMARLNQGLTMAAAHTAAPLLPPPVSGARELSDPGSEPPSYHLFSVILLELIAEADPAAMTPALQQVRQQADRYALELMAPDGQLSFAGRSLDQSWVQAAGAALGVRRASQDQAQAAQWRSFADRAVTYLLNTYPPRPDGIVPIVPGLRINWNPTIMDSYAALDQYEGLTLWLLADALEHWPETSATRAPLPADATNWLVGDLSSSGLVWGRSDSVWWVVSGRSTAPDPRFAQGLIALKRQTATSWRDLLALRPLHHGLSSAWTLQLPDGQTATPVFTAVQGNGHHAVLSGNYRLDSGDVVAPVTWTLTTTASGLVLEMTRPPHTNLQTTVWLTNGNPDVAAGPSSPKRGPCTVTASGQACPITFHWSQGEARLVLGG